MKKEKVKEALNALPDEFNAEELIERLIFIDKIEKGLQDVKEGRVRDIDEAEKYLKQKWQTGK